PWRAAGGRGRCGWADLNEGMIGPGGVRELSARWVIPGELRLESACHLGGGAAGDVVDLPLLRDRVSGRPLLTGSSLAGGLGEYVNDLWLGFHPPQGGGRVAAGAVRGRPGGPRGRPGAPPGLRLPGLPAPER